MSHWDDMKNLEINTSKLLDPYYTEIFGADIKVFNVHNENFSYDRIVCTSDRVYTVDEKAYQIKQLNTGNIVIETCKNVDLNKPGWGYTSNADFMIVTWSDGNKLYKEILTYYMQKVLNFYRNNSKKYRKVITWTGDNYQTEVALIPERDLDKFLLKRIILT